MLKQFKSNKAAWTYFVMQPPGYQKVMRHWVTSAKQEETQLKRLARVIELSDRKQRVDLMAPFGKHGG
ncbi:MAG: YdeI/OmpD-associated family protein [Anaerolineales bacterium]